MQRENFINVETNFMNTEKYIQLLWNANMKKHSDLAFKFRKHDFTRCFKRKQWTENNLCKKDSEQFLK